MTPYRLIVARSAERALAEGPPERVATAVINLITGELLVNPRQVGKPLPFELTGHFSARRGRFRLIFTIADDERTVTVRKIEHRRDVYR